MLLQDTPKRCTRCKQEKPRAEFHRNRTQRDGLHNLCKPCNNEQATAWRKANPERHRASKRAWKEANRDKTRQINRDSARRNYKAGDSTPRARFARYGVEPGEYDRLYREQDGLCGICQEPFDVLAVDHCHETGRVRGLLCHKCNSGIGLLGENPDTLARAIEWIA